MEDGRALVVFVSGTTLDVPIIQKYLCWNAKVELMEIARPEVEGEFCVARDWIRGVLRLQLVLDSRVSLSSDGCADITVESQNSMSNF